MKIIKVVSVAHGRRSRLGMIFVALALATASIESPADARITRLEILSVQSPTFGGLSFGAVGTYEKIFARAYGEVDPTDRRNALITDINLAPRNANGMVEYSADVHIIKPVDISKGNQRIFYDVVNRGNKGHGAFNEVGGNNPTTAADAGSGLLMRRGYTLVFSGWEDEGLVPPGNNRALARLPIARNPDGSSIVEHTITEVIFDNATGTDFDLTYRAANLDQSQAKMLVHNHTQFVGGPLVDRVEVPASVWSYVNDTTVRINRADPFLAPYDQGAAYEFVYPAKDPQVLGLGLAATRDVVSFLRHDTSAENPLRGAIQYVIAHGSSQSGRYLKGFTYWGSGPQSQVGILVMHREANYMNNIACREFSRRGFVVLCMNSRFENNEALVDWELIPLDVAQGVNHLKNVQKVNKVILYGNSGGGVTMSFYQAVAENGPSVCQGSNKLVECGSNLAGIPRADGIILSDGHPGNPILRLRSINPAVNNEKNPERLNPRLDPFDPDNGYNSGGASHYSEEFKSRYFRAQAERMSRLIDDALELLQRIEAGKYIYTDDAPFNIPKFDGARLLSLDPSIRHTTLFPEQLLKNDGSIEVKIIDSIAPSRPELRKANQTFSEGAREGLTVRSFLSSNAIRASNSMDETQIDLCSSNNSTPCMLQHVTVPLLAAANQASFQNLIQEVEINYLYAKSTDKDFIVVEGATTGVTPCTNCPLPASAYSNATKNFFDYAAQWINDRFSIP